MHVARVVRKYKDREYVSYLLRRSFREAGKVRHETLANLTALPPPAIDALRSVLAGTELIAAGEALEIARSLPHGHVAAVWAQGQALDLPRLLGPACPERDLAWVLIVARVCRPASELAAGRWWADTTLALDLGVEHAGTDEVNAALDWLVARQEKIEAALRCTRDPAAIAADFRSLEVVGTDIDDRLRAHALICLLAAYVAGHLRQAWAPLGVNVVDLLDHLATMTRNTVVFGGGQRIEKVAAATGAQGQAFDLLGSSVPLTLR